MHTHLYLFIIYVIVCVYLYIIYVYTYINIHEWFTLNPLVIIQYRRVLPVFFISIFVTPFFAMRNLAYIFLSIPICLYILYK